MISSKQQVALAIEIRLPHICSLCGKKHKNEKGTKGYNIAAHITNASMQM
jgi:hypothetical protein